MHFMTTVIVFTSAASAFSFKGWRKPKVDELRVSEAQEVCGQDTSVRCCNSKTGNANDNKGGFLGLSSTNLNIFNNCFDLSLNVIGILDGTLGKKCSGNVVCCRDFPFSDITGPINDGRPCIDLVNLI